MSTIEFLTRAGCSLCEQGRARLGRVADLLNVAIEDVDVDADDELRREFGPRVPVVRTRSGEVVAEGRLSTAAIAAALLRLRLRGDGSERGRQ